MKKLIFFSLLFFIIKTNSQQKPDWDEILYGDFKGLKTNNIKSLQLKRGDKIVRTIEVDSGQKTIVAKDSLTTDYFEFDSEDRLISIKTIDNNHPEKFTLKYDNNRINELSRLIDYQDIIGFMKWSKLFLPNETFQEKESYSLDKKNKDTLSIFRTKYFFNEKNPDLSYKETYENGKIWNKKYFNQTEVNKEKFADQNIIDSILYVNGKKESFRFENYKDHQIIKIEKDSVLTINKKLGKKVSEKLEYASLPFREIFYDENENVKEKTLYANYRNPIGEMIVWEERKLDRKGKLLYKKYPNKKIYRLKNGNLVLRKNVNRINTCGGYSTNDHRITLLYYIKSFSPSILFSMKLANAFNNIFDTSALDVDEELIYTGLDFKDVPEIKADYSASKDIREELVRTSKSLRRKERYILRYYKDLEVEAVTSDGKKYTINLSQNPEVLSFPIHTFLMQD